MTLSTISGGAVLIGTVATAAAILRPRVRQSPRWHATLTPLASIIGSGFLVLAPILVRDFGVYAPLVMLALCAAAYGFGAVMRFNIARYEPLQAPPPSVHMLELLASWALCFAYVVSVSYYLKLFGSFATAMTAWSGETASRIVTTAVLLLIGVSGLRGGLPRLERMEAAAVSFKLIVIGGLLLGLLVHAGAGLSTVGIVAEPLRIDRWSQLWVAFGLVITVQGFETSRYLGARYDAAMRIRTMRHAQWIATLIYVLYVGFVAASIPAAAMGHSETAVIGMSALVSPLLPVMLVFAALAAQFSAAVADTLGAGGLSEEVTARRVRSRVVYLVVALAGIALTWVVDVFGIIAWASRAFALYYGLQAALAARLAWPGEQRGDRWRSAGFAALAVLGALIVICGRPPE